jgi:hypothetical protein
LRDNDAKFGRTFDAVAKGAGTRVGADAGDGSQGELPRHESLEPGGDLVVVGGAPRLISVDAMTSQCTRRTA